MPSHFSADEWDEYVRKNFGTIPEAEAWRNANNVFVDGFPPPQYSGPLSTGGSAGARPQPQGVSTVDPEEEIDDTLPGLTSFQNVGDWSGAMNALTADQIAATREQQASQKDLYDRARAAILERRYGPSEAERWYALSAAIGAPMVRPSFGGVMRNVSAAMGDFGKAKREAEMSRADALLALEQSYAGSVSAAKQAELKERRAALAAQGPVLARMARPSGSYSATPTGVIFNRGTGYPMPTASHINALLANPGMARDFDIKFGPGAAEQALANFGRPQQ
jgi:hypothetical protein